MGLFSLAKLFGVTLRESANDGSDFTNPDADYRRLFLGEDGLLHVKDSAGTVTDPYTGGGSVATDTIWNAAGDLVQGTGSDTAARLALGTALQVLRVNAGATAVEWAAAAAGTFSGAKVYTTGVAISNAVITFASEVYDTDAYHDTGSNTSRLTVPTTGYYLVVAGGWNSRTDARIRFFVNGAIVRGGQISGASANFYHLAVAVLNLTATDYVEVSAVTVASTTFGDNGTIGDNFTFSIVRLG